jgi:hypothetical protein
MNVRTREFNQNGVVIVSFTRDPVPVWEKAPPGRPFQRGDIGQATKRGEPQVMGH